MHSLQTFYSCRVFPIGVDYLVTGKSEDYRYCSTARSFEDMCGKKEHILQR